MTRTAVFTIVSKNYLHFARTLMQSVKDVHPGWDRHVLLVDEVRNDFDPAAEDFIVTEVRELPLPQMNRFLFRYTILELNTAVKPWMLEYLFDTGSYDRVIYIDPDIYLYRPMHEVEEALSAGSLMVLTPHLTGQLDGKKPTELEIMRAGAYNLGFIALARHPETKSFLHWWQEKLEYQCVVDFEAGLFVDQKWIDLVPGMYPDVSILRHEGYNVAYWNLLHRKLESVDGTARVNGAPLVFCHFSGINPNNPQPLSKHQDRFQLSDLPEFGRLAREYCARVIGNGMATCKQWEYAFGRFSDGTPVEDHIRYCYRNAPDLQALMGDDPFSRRDKLVTGPQNDQAVPVTPVMRHLWNQRPDLKSAFPEIDGRDRLAYAQWFVMNGAAENGIAEEFIAPVRAALDAGVGQLSTVSRLFLQLTYRIGPAAVNLFPYRLRQFVKEKMFGPSTVQDEPTETFSVPRETVTVNAAVDGVNIIGYVRSEHGLGESSRRCAAAMIPSGIPFLLYDFNVGNASRVSDTTYEQHIEATNRYRINLIHINADQMPVLYRTVGSEFFRDRYNIGFWHWELPEFPDEWLGSFAMLNEVWAPTEFVVRAISEKSPVPVVRMPHAIDFRITGELSRAALGLPDNEFLFLTMYDLSSFQARKNPQAVIRAFHEAFPDRCGVKLVVKTQNSHHHPNELRELQEFIAAYPGIIHIDRTMTRQEVYELENLCDCFVSLHRSEGFGLGLAESMFLGKPVIGTDWSANTDFMNHRNSCPVDYELVKLEQSYGPYAAGQVWAHPDEHQAAWYMKRLVEDGAWRREIGRLGEGTIKTEYSPKAVGEMYRKRFKYIGV